MTLSRLLDVLAIASALLAAWLWYRASSNQTRRVSRKEELNALDLNRIVTSINRTQRLNRRAALATAVSALTLALKYGHDLVTGP